MPVVELSSDSRVDPFFKSTFIVRFFHSVYFMISDAKRWLSHASALDLFLSFDGETQPKFVCLNGMSGELSPESITSIFDHGTNVFK